MLFNLKFHDSTELIMSQSPEQNHSFHDDLTIHGMVQK